MLSWCKRVSLTRRRYLVPLPVPSLREPLLRDVLGTPVVTFDDALQSTTARAYVQACHRAHQRLSRTGVLMLDLEPAALAVGLVNRYLAIKAAGLLKSGAVKRRASGARREKRSFLWGLLTREDHKPMLASANLSQQRPHRTAQHAQLAHWIVGSAAMISVVFVTSMNPAHAAPMEAMYLVVGPNNPTPAMAALLRVLEKTAAPEIRLRSARARWVARALRACAADIACLAKVSRKTGSEELLLVRSLGGGTSQLAVQVLVVAVPKAEIARKFELTFTDTPAGRRAVAARKSEIFPTAAGLRARSSQRTQRASTGSSPASPKSAASSRDTGNIALLNPSDPRIAAPGPLEEATSNSEDADSPPQSALTDDKRPTRMAATPLPQLPTLEGSAPRNEPVHPDPPPSGAASTSKLPPARSSTSWLTYTGMAAAAVGTLGAGFGIWMGMQAQDNLDGVERGAGGTTQVEVGRRQQTAQNETAQANLLLALGAGVAAVGGVLILWDQLGETTVTPSVSAGDGGVTASATWSW